MSLLRTPPSCLTDISQILKFAQDNEKALSKMHSVDDDLEIEKFREIFIRMKCAVVLGRERIEGAEDYLQEFNTKLMEMIEAAKNGRDRAVNGDIRWLHNYFIDQRLWFIQIVRFMTLELRNPKRAEKETNRMKMRDENRNPYATREHNNVTPNFQSRLPEIHKSEVGTDDEMEIEVAEDVLNNSEDDGTTNDTLGGNLDLQFHPLEAVEGYGPALNEQQEGENGGDEKLKGWNAPQIPLTADNGTTNNAENDPIQQLSENQKLNFAGDVAPNKNLGKGTQPLLPKAEIEKTLEKMERLHRNSNTNDITLETLSNIRKEKNSSEAHFRDGHAKTVGATGNAPGTSRPSDFQRGKGEGLTEGIQLRTLEDSLRHFGFSGRLEDLEKSLEEMRRGKKTAEEHQEECKKLDKEFQQLSRKHHPDRVTRDGGSQREVTRAKEMQTAINATRTVLKTLSRIFTEDKDIDHRYSFFTKLQLGLLGNEDQVEDHVYQVLFKISLVSEIKQTIIIFEIRNILANAPRCIARYVDNDFHNFVSYRDVVVFHLGRCVAGYKKLHFELKEVLSECKDEQLHNILPTLSEMKRDCGYQLRHFEALLELSKRSFGDLFPMYESTILPVDEYYVRPVISYLNVIFACSAMIRASANTNAACVSLRGSLASINIATIKSWCNNLAEAWNSDLDGIGDPTTADSHFEDTTPKREVDQFNVDSRDVDRDVKDEDEGVDKIERLYQLALAYRGDKRFKAELKTKYRWRSMDKRRVEEMFRDLLKKVQEDLQSTFRIENYVEAATNNHILKACKEMMAEFREKAREVAEGIEEINKQNELGRQQLEQVKMKNEFIGTQIRECRESNKIIFNQIHELQRSRNSRIDLS